MSRRPLPPEPTTSWSAGRSTRPLTRAPRPRQSKAPWLRFFQRLDEAPEVLVLRRERAVEELGAVALDQNGGKVLHLALAHFRGVVLDVEPAKARLRELLRQREEAFAVGP